MHHVRHVRACVPVHDRILQRQKGQAPGIYKVVLLRLLPGTLHYNMADKAVHGQVRINHRQSL